MKGVKPFVHLLFLFIIAPFSGCEQLGPDFGEGTSIPGCEGNKCPSVDEDSFNLDTTSPEVIVTYTILDSDHETVDLYFEYSLDSGETFSTCTPSSSEESEDTTGVTVGEAHTFIWDSCEDIEDDTEEVILRVTPDDGCGCDDSYTPDSFSLMNKADCFEGGRGDFPEPGSVEPIDFESEGVADIPLNNETTDRDNTTEEFMIILVNFEEGSAGYNIDDVESTEKRMSKGGKGPVLPEEGRKRGRGVMRAGPERAKAVTRQDELEIGMSFEFRVRDSLDDENSFTTISATLWGLGEGVGFFVDDDIPIDIDYNCDGIFSGPDIIDWRDSYGFDNCDLENVASIIDYNILPNLRAAFGEESDVDGNEMISVLLTPILNRLTLEDDSEENDDRLIESFSNPNVDLMEFDANSNPGSNYQEIVYMRSPDPEGIFNNKMGGGGEDEISEFVSVDLAANVAISLESIISYNWHVIQQGFETEEDIDPEEDWLNDGLAYLAADLTGFGSVVYDDVAYFLDAPHNYSLLTENDLGDVNDRGLQYLFCRYLYERFGESVVSDLIQSAYVGIDNIENATGEDFDELYIYFSIALWASGLEDTDGTSLVDTSAFPQFSDAETLVYTGPDGDPSTPPETPVAGEFFGANGYQQGINIRGANLVKTGGLSDTQEVIDTITLHGPDYQNFAPGIDFFGYINEIYGIQYVRVGYLLKNITNLKVTSTGKLGGAVVRMLDIDIEKRPLLKETVFGSLSTDIIDFAPFEDGTERVMIGEIDLEDSIYISDTGQTDIVYDFDRYRLDLSAYDEAVPLAIWANRRFMSTTGDTQLDPMLAIIPEGDLPDPYDLNGYTCTTSNEVYYPFTLLSYLHSQFILAPDPSEVRGDFDPSGPIYGEETSCTNDFDSDGVINEEEPLPESLSEQILVYQTTMGGSEVEGFYPYNSNFIDWDSTDGDDTALIDMVYGVGGINALEGEEALYEIELEPASYIILVAGEQGTTGPYDLYIRILY